MSNLFSRRAALGGALAGFATAFAEDPKQPPEDAPHPKIDPSRIHRYEQQDLTVEDFAADGLILDIGGGGEGIIGCVKGEQVVAIDLNRRELAGAPAGPLKLVMDATDLKFLDDSFATATSFFTLMYMKPEDQQKAMNELHRVLKPGGRALVWDIVVPAQFDPKKDIVVYRFRFLLPKGEVKTGYGAKFPDRPHDLPYYEALAKAAGFSTVRRSETGRTCFVELRKA